MKLQIRKTFFCTTFLLSSVVLFAQQTAEKYVIEMNYLQYLPKGYEKDTTTCWPVLVSLHGAGETGADINKVRGHGLAKLIEDGRQFPFIVLSPQTKTHGWKPNELKDLLQDAFTKLRVDYDRVYLTGLSMGGYGTWSLAIFAPEMFAAIAPVCGGGSVQGITRLRNMPVWCFHGDADNVVPLSESETMVNALKEYNSNVKFTVYPGVGHESWDPAYENDVLFDWLLQQKRHKNIAIELDKQILEKYAGTYQVPDGFEIRYTIEGNGLRSWYGEEKGMFYQPAAENEFFHNDYSPIFYRFEKGENGEITGITTVSYGEYTLKRINN